MCHSDPQVPMGTSEVRVLAELREEATRWAHWMGVGRAICTFRLASKAVPGADSVPGCCVVPRERQDEEP